MPVTWRWGKPARRGRHGASPGARPFVPERRGAVAGVSNLPVYAVTRGQTLEAFQAARNAPGAMYPVTGKDPAVTWDGGQPARWRGRPP